MNASPIAASTASTPVAAKTAIVQPDVAAKTDFRQLLRQASSGGGVGRPVTGAGNRTPVGSPQWLQSASRRAPEQPETEPSPNTPDLPDEVVAPGADALPDSEYSSATQQAVSSSPTHTTDAKDIITADETNAHVAATPSRTTMSTLGANGRGTRGVSGKASKQGTLAQTGKRADASQVQTLAANIPPQIAPQLISVAQWGATPPSLNKVPTPTAEVDTGLRTASPLQQSSPYSYINAGLNGDALGIAAVLPQAVAGSLVAQDGVPARDDSAPDAILAADTTAGNAAFVPSASGSPASTTLGSQSDVMGRAKADENAALSSVNTAANTTTEANAFEGPAAPMDPAQIATPTLSAAPAKDNTAVLSSNTASAANQTPITAATASSAQPPELAQVATSAGSPASATQVLSTGKAKAVTQPPPIPPSKISSRSMPQNNAARNTTSRVAVPDGAGAKPLETPSKTNSQDALETPQNTATGLVPSPNVGDSVSPKSARIGRKQVDAAGKSAPDIQDDATSVGAGTEHNGDASVTLGASAHLTPLAQVATTPQITSATPDTSHAASSLLQGLQGVPAAPAHAAQSSAQPASAAHSSTQSAPVSEPAHTLDNAQLRVHGSVSELKISVQLPELGKVEVRAVSTHDATTAHITATHDALPVFAAGRAGLEEVLKLHDVTLGSFSSPTQGQSNGQHSQQSFHRPSQQQSNAAPETAMDGITAESDRSSFLPDHTSISVRA